ncbi:hypothetical protein MKZ38_010487 [Zalerion maritima]|uniref:Uncharacterized protein n=1 Tax=Zalerion maritima TaxID=339359 RepID=A0AAD5RSA6_9PEZI|nr:hypothetical protein MKZ38_010487 [Zalerion maritima]
MPNVIVFADEGYERGGSGSGSSSSSDGEDSDVITEAETTASAIATLGVKSVAAVVASALAASFGIYAGYMWSGGQWESNDSMKAPFRAVF